MRQKVNCAQRIAQRRMGTPWWQGEAYWGQNIVCVEGTEYWQHLAEAAGSEFSLEELGDQLPQTDLNENKSLADESNYN